MPGGIFPYPPAVVTLLSMLPPPTSFRGPFVAVDELVNHYTTSGNAIPLAESTVSGISSSNRPLEPLQPNEARSYFSLAVDASESFQLSIAPSGGGGDSRAGGGYKRQLPQDEEEEGEGEGGNLLPPQFDIYRTRQLHKKPRNWKAKLPLKAYSI